MVSYVRPALRRRLATALVVVAIAGCGTAATASPASTPVAPPSAELASSSPADGEAVVLVGRIVTLDQPAVAEALFIKDGTVVAVGTREDVLALAGDRARILELGSNVAYPGFIDAHAHWIGDREYYDIDTAAEAIDAALTRGWTSISEQWVNPERLEELESLDAADALPLRVDAYLALNFDKELFGDWYTSREPGAVKDLEPGDRLVELTDDLGRPFDQIAAGMDGRARMRPKPPVWAAGQLLTAEQGLRAVTLDAAYALGDEARRGHLAPGTMGDVTVLSGDIATSTPDEIRALEVVATIVGGNVVYCSDAAVCGGPR